MIRRTLVFSFLFLCLGTFPLAAQDTLTRSAGKPWLNVWGMVNLDIIHDLDQMDPQWIGGFRPSKIPVHPGDPGWGSSHNTWFSLRQSTFKFEGVMPVQHRLGPIRLRFEFDLFGMGVNAGETTFRLRLAYGQWGPFLVGKDWSTFIDLESFPNHFDFWGPSGMALLASVMVRYSRTVGEANRLEAALELPGSEIDPGQLRQIDPAFLNIQSKEQVPDLILRYTRKGAWGHVRVAGMARMLSYDVISQQAGKSVDHALFGWAFNVTSNLYLFDRQGWFNLQTVFGHGYAGYNNDGGVEITPTAGFRATVPFQYGMVAFYNHNFSRHWSVSAGYSETSQHNTPGQLDNAFHRSQYILAQTIWNILDNKAVQAGLCGMYGKKYEKDGSSARDRRIMFTVRFQMDHIHKPR